ncbi:MAG: protein kinase [Parabacteroides sp.]|nr:protein kinase [Parabacteroides sp.]
MNLPNGHPLQNGKYRLTHVVGQGGFGITYKGVWYTEVKGPLGTIKTEVPICVKEYFFKDYYYRDSESFAVRVHSETGRALFEKFKEKLIKEAKILSDVHHPHIVNVLEVFEENDTAYIAMEYISGNSLKYMMDKEGVLPEARVLRYVHQIGEALQFVHEKNILHLDIKPSNILIDHSGKARLIDFGVSKRYDIEQQETSTTMLTLSKGFASIEQYDNEGTQNFSPCPDIYSLGATMYNLLTGKIPTESILRATRPLPAPKELNPAISDKTEAVIIKAMQIIPADRFQSVSEMLAELDYPQEEGKKVIKDISSPEYFEEDEITILFTTRLPQSKGVEDDETVLQGMAPSPVSKKKRRKVTLISLLIIIFASLGSALALLVQRYKPVPPVAELINSAPDIETDSVTESIAPIVTEESNIPEVIKEEPEVESDKKETGDQQEKQTKPVVTPEVTASRQVEPVKPTEPAASDVEQPAARLSSTASEEIKSEFLALIASGKDKMAATDYSGSKSDFSKAKALATQLNGEDGAPLIEEVVRLEMASDEKYKEQQIAKRKALYELKMAFGKYTIVRKKSDNTYGAIDSEGIERIPCKYTLVGKVDDKRRAFGRDDGSFDIYNTDGDLIGEGLPYY